MGIRGRGANYCAQVVGGGRNELRPYKKIYEICRLAVHCVLRAFLLEFVESLPDFLGGFGVDQTEGKQHVITLPPRTGLGKA